MRGLQRKRSCTKRKGPFPLHSTPLHSTPLHSGAQEAALLPHHSITSFLSHLTSQALSRYPPNYFHKIKVSFKMESQITADSGIGMCYATYPNLVFFARLNVLVQLSSQIAQVVGYFVLKQGVSSSKSPELRNLAFWRTYFVIIQVMCDLRLRAWCGIRS